MEAMRWRSLPFAGLAASGWSWLCLVWRGKRGTQGLLRFTPVERAKIGSERGFRPDGKRLASRARLFDPEPRAPAGSGTAPSDPLHGASRAQPLMKILGLARLGRRAHGPARTAAMNLILRS